MKYIEAKISVELKKPVHFQYAPELISNYIKEAVSDSENYDYVFSNLGKANSEGMFEYDGVIALRSFSQEFIDKAVKNLLDFENEHFKTKNIYTFTSSFQPINTLYTLNPAFVLIDENIFWTFKSSGDFELLEKLILDDLVEKYERNFGEKLEDVKSFIKIMNIKNEKPFSYMYDDKKYFGYKVLINPKEDEISQKLAFTAVGCGLGHKNKEVGGGFTKILN
ncbi:hypothetical protein [Caminibacter pacificus]|jgi:CRISPR-associated endoribonuclease Cas6|uniref:CRISPR-associated endoribonuclease Cas6 n=1 Tax=Caminibacter pacificus TaxID=1424653 RepID=A0AAJ4UYN8_9BACT|nr:hypothetical protein [Caminibacter pacificus]NPA88060.1 hypothetical protein [Campylobacterota bacterium]QCI28224.1 hypothetical protein C6V80_04415 [Caminibacter pacificus]ROR41062.1 CRISPR-associated endoribonuclease Cas6 [Caminibacter pacificus]